MNNFSVIKMNQKKIYIVDDHPLFRQGIRTYIQLHHLFNVVGECGDGETALQYLVNHQVDILLIDLNIPKIDGISLIKELKKLQNNCKIIVISQSLNDEAIYQLSLLGINGAIQKTDPNEEIIKALEIVSNNGNYITPFISQKLFRFIQSNNHTQNIKPSKINMTPRELEIARLVSEGKTNKLIAQKLSCSEFTVKTHKANFMRKIGAKNAVEVSRWVLSQCS